MGKTILAIVIIFVLLGILGLGGFSVIAGLIGGLFGLIGGIFGLVFGLIGGILGGLFGIGLTLIGLAMPLIILGLVVGGVLFAVKSI
ncbi:MAG: hypothetical protein CVT49_13450 [candidate division Zixibacteria bacterium HGW-Zixibacteria-1]|nr:MAG: hypothetical protein CVT49_13450 [candidate division Zixibacteria bacterium HGW-Zixibacteria-1]